MGSVPKQMKDCIDGLQKLVDDGLEKSLILITGAPGTLKSTIVLALLSNYLKGKNETGLYITLEQSSESHLRNLKSIGIEKPENLKIADFNDLRRKYRFMENKLNIFQILSDTIHFFKGESEGKFTCLAIDSLNAAYSFESSAETRTHIYHLFNVFREYDLTTFVIKEIPNINILPEYPPEFFLADGIIELGTIERQDEVIRYIQIKKMRNTRHSMKKHRLTLKENGIVIMGPVYG